MELVLDGLEEETAEQIRTRAQKIEPLGQLVLVLATKQEKTKGGIILPEASREAPAEGEVLSVGPGHLLQSGVRHPCQVKPGDQVLFGSTLGAPVAGFDDVYLVPEAGILARKRDATSPVHPETGTDYTGR